MAYKYFTAEWVDVYNKSGGWSKVYGNKPIRVGGSSDYQTFIKVPQAAIDAINNSNTTASLHMQLYITTAGSEIDVGSHNHNSARSTGASGIPSYSYSETIHSPGTGWYTYQMSNAMMPRLVAGTQEGVVLYNTLLKYTVARGIGESNAVRFRVTGEWEEEAKASIPTLSKSTFNIGERIYISTDRNKDNLTHIVQFSLGSIEKEEITRSVTGSTGWTPSNDLAEEIINSTERTGTIHLLTYEDGNKYIGTESVNFKLRVPDNATFNPEFNREVIEITGGLYDNLSNQILQNITKLHLLFSLTTKYSAKVAGNNIIVDGVRYDNKYDIIANPIKNSGNITIRFEGVDTRGRTIAKDITINVKPYNIPEIKSFDVKRTTQNKAVVIANAIWSKINTTNPNNLVAVIKYKEVSESYYTVLKNITVDNSGVLNYSEELPNFLPAKSYDLILEIKDDMQKDANSALVLGTTVKAFTIGKKGDKKGVGINKIWQGIYELEVAGDAEIEGLIYSEGYKIFDRGGNLNGEYIKFSNGTLICYIQKDEISVSASARTEGNLSAYFKDAVITFPSAFIDIPAVVVDANSLTKTMVNVFSNSYSRRVTENNFYLRSWANTQFDKIVDVSVIAIGRWK